MPLVHTPDNPDLGSACPDFKLNSVDDKSYSLQDFSDKKALVVMFICNHCPYVQAIEDRLIALQRHFSNDSVQLLGVCSNDAERYPDDSKESLLARWTEKEYQFPYLFDESQEMAKSFGAVCTPDFFVYDQNRKLTYRGRLDDSWKEPEKVSQEELKQSIQCILDDNAPLSTQNPSMGCSIKWLDS